MSGVRPTGRIEEPIEWRRVDAMCDRFETAWEQGERPQIEDYVTMNGAWRSVLLRELLLVEIEARRRRGETPIVVEYVERFPELASEINKAFEASRDSERGLVPGERLGRYRVERRIESGSFGRVYLARDEQLDRRVAIKISRRSEGNASAELINEARTLAGLDHPGIVRVFDVGELSSDAVFLVMEYIADGTLAERLAQARVSWQAVAEYAVQIAEALHEVHRHGLVHRDLKPHNILIDSDNRIRLTDFGLSAEAPAIADALPGDAGTPCYMAPEQLRDPPQASTASDIWSLGVIMYEALTGRRPHTLKQLVSCAADMALPPPPSPDRIEPRVPKWLGSVVLSCLSSNVEDRPASAAWVARKIERHLSHRRVDMGRRAALTLAATSAAGLSWLGARRFYAVGVPSSESCRLQIVVWPARDKQAVARRIDQPNTLPLRPGDLVQVHWQSQTPLWPYLAWIDSRGQVAPIYPQVKCIRDWSRSVPHRFACREVRLPRDSAKAWPMEVHESGLETLVALARLAPLDANEVARVEKALREWRPVRVSLAERDTFYRFRRTKLEEGTTSRYRGPQVATPTELRDPVIANQLRLVRKLGSWIPSIDTLSFSCLAST